MQAGRLAFPAHSSQLTARHKPQHLRNGVVVAVVVRPCLRPLIPFRGILLGGCVAVHSSAFCCHRRCCFIFLIYTRAVLMKIYVARRPHFVVAAAYALVIIFTP